MHFSIPTTEEIKDENGTLYTAFNIHVNGVLHCAVRYSQLNDLNEKLKQEFGASTLPAFPPKRFFAVKGIDLDERKLQLENYIQDLCQDQRIANSDIFAVFLSKAQQETKREASLPVNFELYLMNGSKLKINIQSTDKTDAILENATQTLGLNEDLTYYFGLFLVKHESGGRFHFVRMLQEFECPYISLKSVQEPEHHKVVLRKTYWDQSYDDVIIKDGIGLNLLQVQAESDIKTGWITCSTEAKNRLRRLKAKGSKKEYVQFCQTLCDYGYFKFSACQTDFPKKENKVCICIGNSEIKFDMQAHEKEEKMEKFLVTRIKCWKISAQYNKKRQTSDETPTKPELQLCFEYLVSKGNLKWITIASDQAIMMSMCIKSMIDELLRKRKGEKIKKPTDRTNSKVTFKPRDKTTEALFYSSEVQLGEADSGMQKAKDSVKKLTDKLSNTSITSKPLTDNTSKIPQGTAARIAFEKIGDEDL